MKKVLITGGFGYVGGFLTKLLQDLNYEITVTTSRKDLVKEDDSFNIRYMNLLNEDSIYDICRNTDVVIHTATFDERLIKEKPREALLVNTYGTKLILESAVRYGVEKFIYLSTFHVYGKGEGIVTEDTPTTPIADYGMTHLFSELYCRQFSELYNLDVIITRSTNGVGLPRFANTDRWYLALNDFCKTVFNEQKIKLKTNGLQLRDFICIKDVVQGVLQLIQHDISPSHFEIYNISSEKTISIRDLAVLISSIYRSRYKKDVELDIPEVESKDNVIKELLVDSKKLRKLGWMTTLSIEDAINEVFDHLEYNGGFTYE